MLVERALDGVLRDRVEITLTRILEYSALVKDQGYYVAFSGGKDSIVLLDLMERSGVSFDAHFNFTTVDPPELVRYIREYYPEVQWHRPQKSMFQIIVDKHMPPTRLKRYCCDLLKERGGSGRMVATGVRWEESPKRRDRMMVERCIRDSLKHFFNPIIDWKSEEIWAYIRSRGLPYCSLYDEGFTRIGCIMCPMHASCKSHKRKNQMEIDAERWPKFYNAYLGAFKRMLQHNPTGKKLTWNSPEEVMHWWIYKSNMDLDTRQVHLAGTE